MKQELISVIVPIYNVEYYLEKCIDSIIKQTYRNLEILLIDDGSTDNCGKICDKYKKIDNRIQVIHKSNEGLSSARNYGLDIAKGEYISFIDSDDYIEHDMLEKLKSIMDLSNSDISICNFFQVKKAKKKYHSYKKPCFIFKGKNKFYNLQNEFSNLTLYAWNKLYKRNIFETIRYPMNRIFEDSYVICDILDKAEIVSYISEPLYNHVYRIDSIVNTFNSNHFHLIDSYNKKIDFYHKKNFFDLEMGEKKRKMTSLIIKLSKMKKYGIKDKEIENKYYQELVNTNKEVKWKDSTKYVKFYKVFRKPSISILACMLRVRDLVKKQ